MRKIFKQQAVPPWSYLAALGAFIAMFLSIIIGSTVAGTLLGDAPIALVTGWSIGMALTIGYVVFSRRRDPQSIEALRLSETSVRLPLVALFAFGMAVLFDLVSWVVVGEQTLANAELLTFSAGDVSIMGWLVALLFLILLQPVGEEMVLRGMMYPAFSAALGGRLGFFAVSAFHAMFHFLAYTPAVEDQTVFVWYGLGLPLLYGLTLTAIRAQTGSTRAAIVAHAMFGAFALLKVITFA